MRKGTDIKFRLPEDLRGFVEMIAVKNGINMGEGNIIQTFADKKSSPNFIYRFTISIDTINSTEESYLHIREISNKKVMQDLIDLKMLDLKMVEYLDQRREKGYVIICGKNGTGKMHLLNVLLDEIPAKKSVLVVQENKELFSNIHPDMTFQHITVRKMTTRSITV